MVAQTIEQTSAERAFLDNLFYLSNNDLDSWIQLWHEDGIYEVPFAPAGTATLVQGRSKVYDYMGFVLKAMEPVPGESKHWLFWDIKTYTTTEPETVIAEYKGRSKIALSGHIYTQRYIARVTTSNGKITLYREYWNPLIFLDGLGSLEVAQDAFASLSFGS
jgi:hypothetical protein